MVWRVFLLFVGVCSDYREMVPRKTLWNLCHNVNQCPASFIEKALLLSAELTSILPLSAKLTVVH